MLLVFRPFRVGDVIIVAGHTGKVDEIGLFVTTLDTPDNRRLLLPNSAIFGATIENVTHHATRRADISIGVAYGADLDETRRVLSECVREVSGVLEEPAPVVVLSGLADSSVNWSVRLWCQTTDYFAVLEGGTRAVKRALDQAGIGIPYPTMDVNFVQPLPMPTLAALPATRSLPPEGLSS
jgi:small conductance mechanosensitive channel